MDIGIFWNHGQNGIGLTILTEWDFARSKGLCLEIYLIKKWTFIRDKAKKA